MRAQLLVFGAVEGRPAHGQACQQHNDQRGKDAANAAAIELADGERAGIDAAKDDPGNQVARHDEEDVDADEAGRERCGKEVVRDDREHGDGAQAVDVGAVFQRRGNPTDRDPVCCSHTDNPPSPESSLAPGGGWLATEAGQRTTRR